MTDKHAKNKALQKPIRENFIRRVDFEQELKNINCKSLMVHLIGGNLIIQGSTSQDASIKIQWNEQKSNLPKFYCEEEVLYLSARSLRPFIQQKNAYIIELTIPLEMDVKIKMYGGVIFIDKIKGDNLDIHMKAGTISGYPKVKNLTAKLVAGDINMHQLEGSADISVGVGDIGLSFDSITSDSKINLSCKLGDIRLNVPKGTLASNDAIKGEKIENSVGAEISAKVWVGDLKIGWSEEL